MPIGESCARDLVTVLNSDDRLAAALGGARRPLTVGEFIGTNAAWAEKHRACIYAIAVDGVAVGTISLSRIDEGEASAEVGYWLASEHWGRGHGTEAFRHLAEIARAKGIRRLSARMLKDNPASMAIWRRLGATFEDRGDRWQATLSLD